MFQPPVHLDIAAVCQPVLKELYKMAQSLPKPRRASVGNATDDKFPTTGPQGPPKKKPSIERCIYLSIEGFKQSQVI